MQARRRVDDCIFCQHSQDGLKGVVEFLQESPDEPTVISGEIRGLRKGRKFGESFAYIAFLTSTLGSYAHNTAQLKLRNVTNAGISIQTYGDTRAGFGAMGNFNIVVVVFVSNYSTVPLHTPCRRAL